MDHNYSLKTLIGMIFLKCERIIYLLTGVAMSLSVVFAFHSFYLYFLDFSEYTLLPGAILYLVLLILSLYISLKPSITSLKFSRGQIFPVISNTLILAMAVFCFISLNSDIVTRFAFWVTEHTVQSRWLTNGTSEIRLIILAVTLGIGVRAFHGVWRKREVERIITLIHAVGFAVYLETVGKIWNTLSDIHLYRILVAQATAVYGIAVLFLIAVAWTVKKRGNGNV